MDLLCMDVKIYIGCIDRKVWIKLYTYDKLFKDYAVSESGVNMFIQTFRPKYITLPDKYKGTIKELLPPKPRYGVRGRPFYNSFEVTGVIYKDSKFLLSDSRELLVGDKGYQCIGCYPGSYPQPVIVAAIDHEKEEVGLIYPFVYKKEINEEYVMLQVGKDMGTDDHQFDKIYYNIHDHAEVFKPGDKYKVFYFKADNIMNSAYCLDIGSFGNIDLPTKDGKIPYEYI